MAAVTRRLPTAFRTLGISSSRHAARALPASQRRSKSTLLEHPPKGNDPQTPARAPPAPPPQDEAHVKGDSHSASFLGTTKRLPEFNLTDKVVLVSGAARGLGLVQAEALLEAGATVYALDRLPEPSPEFYRVQKRAAEELGTTFYYKQIDVRDVDNLNTIVAGIGDLHGRMDGLVAAAGIQQEVPALDYTAKDANTMFEVNITGVFMTAQAVAKQMIKYGNGGSMAFIASMSATIANRVRLVYTKGPLRDDYAADVEDLGSDLPCLQCFQSWCCPIGPQSRLRMGPRGHSREHHITWLHRHGYGGGTLQIIS